MHDHLHGMVRMLAASAGADLPRARLPDASRLPRLAPELFTEKRGKRIEFIASALSSVAIKLREDNIKEAREVLAAVCELMDATWPSAE